MPAHALSLPCPPSSPSPCLSPGKSKAGMAEGMGKHENAQQKGQGHKRAGTKCHCPVLMSLLPSMSPVSASALASLLFCPCPHIVAASKTQQEGGVCWVRRQCQQGQARGKSVHHPRWRRENNDRQGNWEPAPPRGQPYFHCHNQPSLPQYTHTIIIYENCQSITQASMPPLPGSREV